MNTVSINAHVTLQDVARRVGVSHVTVSRVLNGRPHIAATTRQLVLDAVREMGYRPDASARALVKGRKGDFPVAVEVVFCHLHSIEERPSGSFQIQVLHGINEVAREDGHAEVHMGYWQNGVDAESQLLRLLRSNGVLLMGNSDRAMVESLLSHQLPVVLVDHEHEGLEADAVESDNVVGGRMAVRRLLAAGHRRIGWLGGPPLYIAYQQRLFGVRSELADAGLALAPRDCRTAPANEPMDFEQIIGAWLSEGDLPSALIVGASFAMPVLLHVLREHGRRYPEDVSIVCFDHDAYTAVCRPEPTSVATFPREIGRCAMERLLKTVRATRPEPPLKLVVPMKLVEGGSVQALGAPRDRAPTFVQTIPEMGGRHPVARSEGRNR